MKGVINVKKVLINNKIIDVEFFESRSNKVFPYFQNGNKYAICPYCKTSVQIINGNNNKTKSNQKKIYASHTKNMIEGIKFDAQVKKMCIYYEGNKNNWQQIYTTKNISIEENRELKEYILENISEISKEIEEITGFKCTKKLFDKIYNSFLENKGLCTKVFAPDYVSRSMIYLSNPIECWGHIIVKDNIKNKINKNLTNSIVDNKFIPNISTRLVGVLDNDYNPKKIIIKLLYDNTEVVINEVSAEVK